MEWIGSRVRTSPHVLSASILLRLGLERLRIKGAIRVVLLVVLILSVIPAPLLLAGPPFLTDDPVPVPFKHWEFYIFSTVDKTRTETNLQGPAFEFNVGAVPNLQIHLVLTIAGFYPQAGPQAYGFGDTEVGIKYRFLQETDYQPMAGVFPMIEIPTGNADLGLGNGWTWWRLPLWLEKSWGPWTTDAGGGYVVNPAPGQRNYYFGGWLLTRDFGQHLTLGGEIFAQGKSSDDTRSFMVFNLGGYIKITPNFQILFTGGHTLAGGNHTIGYLGLYWTGGFGSATKMPPGPKSIGSPLRIE
jgi:hypothetical protein